MNFNGTNSAPIFLIKFRYKDSIRMGVNNEKQIKFLRDNTVLEYEIIGVYYIGFRKNGPDNIQFIGGDLFNMPPTIMLDCGHAMCLRYIIKCMYSLQIKLNRQHDIGAFAGLLKRSEVSPIYADYDFMRWFLELYIKLKSDFSFNIGFDGLNMIEYIECHNCGVLSYNDFNIKNLYCSTCDTYHPKD